MTDEFYFSISPPPSLCTKRAILSATARLYDVLGLVGPVILLAKLLIKKLWLLKLAWDDTPPYHIINQWQRYISELPLLSQLRFPRHVGVEKSSRVSLLAFADASEKAYGSVIYLHVENQNEKPKVSLVCSKSRVSSPSRIVTLARLELSALVLLARLVRTVYDTSSKRHQIDNIFVFSDSTVALCWVSSSPHRFNTYVANRISQFQSLLSPDNLYHVAGSQNPADCISRGLLPSQIMDHELWHSGPSWTLLPSNEWPIERFSPSSHDDLPEAKTVSHVVTTTEDENPIIKLSLKFSSWIKYLRATVYLLRFIKKLPRNDIITANDLDSAESTIIKAFQNCSFHNDISNIQNKRTCSAALKKLYPFISDNILRVGGRLGNSDLNFCHKHPALLPRKGHIIDLIIDYYHRENCHAGPQLLLSIVRQKY